MAFQYPFDFRVGAFDEAFVDHTGAAVDGDVVALFEGDTVRGECFALVVYGDVTGAADAHFAQLTGNQSGVGRNSTSGSQDAL